MCGSLRLSDAGKKVVLMGWVNRRRDLGSIIFIDLRDRAGVTQVVFNRELNPAAHDKAESLRNEYVIAVTGAVKQRDRDTVNKNIPTGEVELVVEELRLLNESKQPPFLPGEAVLPNEEMRLKYRYIDLRRDVMQFNIEMRHKVSKAIRDYLSEQGFFEIETPFMTRSSRSCVASATKTCVLIGSLNSRRSIWRCRIRKRNRCGPLSKAFSRRHSKPRDKGSSRHSRG